MSIYHGFGRDFKSGWAEESRTTFLGDDHDDFTGVTGMWAFGWRGVW